MQSSMGRSGVLDVKAPMMLKGEYKPSFPLRLMHKDMSLALDLANQLGVPLPAAAAAREILSAVKGAMNRRCGFCRPCQLLAERTPDTSDAAYGFASGGRKHIGRSRDVRSPAGASRIAGMQFTTTEAVAMSPCVPPGMVSVRLGLPVISTVSPGSARRRTSAIPCRFFPFPPA